MRISLFITVGLVIAAPALAHKEGDTPKTPADPNKVICKTDDVIGSHLQSEKRCMTAAQWEQDRRNNRDNMDTMQRSGGNGR